MIKFSASIEELTLYINKVGLYIYFPRFRCSKSVISLSADTGIILRPLCKYDAWRWLWAFVIKFMGFGVGISYNHCENPFYDSELARRYGENN